MLPYFAYGSNLSLPHLKSWLARYGVALDQISRPRRALLHDHGFRTNYLRSLGLGAANIEQSDGDLVEGIVFSISPEAHEVLRIKEGHPTRYQEIDVEVEIRINRRRQMVHAMTYMVAPAHRLPIDLPVSPEYRQLILNGAKSARLSRSYQDFLKSFLATSVLKFRKVLV